MKKPVRKTLFYLLAVSALFLQNSPAMSYDAWNLRDGEYKLSLLFSRIDSRQEFNTLALRAPYLSEFSTVHDGEYSTTDIILRGAYGVTPDITLIGETQVRQSTLSYVDTAQVFVQRANSGIGDIYLAARWGIVKEPFGLTAQVGWKIPAASSGDVTSVALGNGEMDFDGMMSAGYECTIAGMGIAGQSQFGMLFRGGNYGDAFMYREDMAVMIAGGRAGLHGALHGFISQGPIKSVTETDIPAGFGLTNNRSLMEFTVGAKFKVSGKVLFVLDLSRGVNGRSALTGNTLTLGIEISPGQSTPLTPKR